MAWESFRAVSGVEGGGGRASLKALFRERPLSDYIGFTAARTAPKMAAEHLRVHLQHIAQVMPQDGIVLLRWTGKRMGSVPR